MLFRRLLLRSTKLESVAPLRPVVPEIMFMGSLSLSLRRKDQQHGNAVPVCQRFEHTDVPIVVGVGAHAVSAVPGMELEELTALAAAIR